jgi:hypothetical protein
MGGMRSYVVRVRALGPDEWECATWVLDRDDDGTVHRQLAAVVVGSEPYIKRAVALAGLLVFALPRREALAVPQDISGR